MRQPNFGGPRGPQAQAGFQRVDKNTRSIIGRMARLVLGDYKLSIGVVLVCIVITSFTTLASTLFTRTLIDDYIVPLTQADNPAYASLQQALFRLGLILLLGVVCSYLYNRLMINVSQGTQLRLRKAVFQRMERLPISYFDQRSHGDIMSVYTNDIDSLRQMIPPVSLTTIIAFSEIRLRISSPRAFPKRSLTVRKWLMSNTMASVGVSSW